MSDRDDMITPEIRTLWATMNTLADAHNAGRATYEEYKESFDAWALAAVPHPQTQLCKHCGDEMNLGDHGTCGVPWPATGAR